MLKALLIAIIIGTSTIVSCSESTTEESLTSKEKRVQNEEKTNYTNEKEKADTEDNKGAESNDLVTITDIKTNCDIKPNGKMEKIDGQWTFVNNGYIKGGNTGKLSFYVNNNTGLEISYIECYIYFYDKDGKVMNSDWCNETNIPKDSSRKVTTYVDYPTGFETCKVVINDIKF